MAVAQHYMTFEWREMRSKRRTQRNTSDEPLFHTAKVCNVENGFDVSQMLHGAGIFTYIHLPHIYGPVLYVNIPAPWFASGFGLGEWTSAKVGRSPFNDGCLCLVLRLWESKTVGNIPLFLEMSKGLSHPQWRLQPSTAVLQALKPMGYTTAVLTFPQARSPRQRRQRKIRGQTVKLQRLPQMLIHFE